MQAQSSSDRLLNFLRACGYVLPDVSAEELFIVLSVATDQVELPDDEQILLRLATLTTAYVHSLKEALAGNVRLDVREEAIMEAALQYIRSKPCAS